MTSSLIVTITDETNYGNRLQNYALTQLLMAYGDCTTARFILSLSTSREYYKIHVSELLHFSKVKSGIKASLHLRSAEEELEWRRLQKMKHFTKEYAPNDCFELTEYKGLVSKPGASFDTVVLGSDQIWNPNFVSLEELKLHLGASFDKLDEDYLIRC